jgi:hypothetical protein
MLFVWWSARVLDKLSRLGSGSNQSTRLNLEVLEDRTLLSTIAWTNRGNAYADTDSFNAVFGANAPTARAVVDAVLQLWQNTITSFNYADGSNTLSLTISMNPSARGNGAVSWSGVRTDGHGKPEAGAIQIDSGSDGHGGGYYLDPNPFSRAFAGTLDNPYARDGVPGTTPGSLGDLFTLVGHEVLHTLGMSFNPSLAFAQNYTGYLRNTGQPDVVDHPGTLFTFTGPDVQALFTSDDGDSSDVGGPEHTARAGNSYTEPFTHVTYTGVIDVVNPIYNFGRRMLPSLMDALVLKDAYGYAVLAPLSFLSGTSTNVIAAGTGPGGAPSVQVFDAPTGALKFGFNAYDAGFRGGVCVAVGDVFGTGTPVVVTAPGPGSTPDIRLWDVSTGALLADFLAYAPGFTGGVTVAVGDVNGDGFADIVTGTEGGNPDVRVFSGKALATGTMTSANPYAGLLAHWFAYGLNYNVGTNVAVGDINHDGYADIVTGASTGNPHVKVYNGKDIATGVFDGNNPDASVIASFFPYALQFDVGANVAVGDVNHDGYADIITGASIGNPDVRVYSGRDIAAGTFNPYGASQLAQWFAYGLQYDIGVTVAVSDINGDGFDDVITGTTWGSPQVKVYNGRAIAAGALNGADADANLLVAFFASTQANGVMIGAKP